MHWHSEERRREIRKASGEGLILIAGHPVVREIHARLMDVSQRGFRASHSDPLLEPGQTVRFRYATLEGDARVIWNRIVGQQVETGFLLL